MILYVDGDSYSTPGGCVDPVDSYWSKFGAHIQATKIVNFAYPGKSNNGMIRNATRFCLDHPEEDLFVLIGFSHLERYDYFDEHQHSYKSSKTPNPLEFGVVSEHAHQNQDRIQFYNREFEESKFLSALINFHGGLTTRPNIKFMLHSCTNPLVISNMPLLERFYQEVQSYPRVINLFNDTYLSLNQRLGVKPVDFDAFKWQGHHGPEGNATYAELLINAYNDLYEN